MNRYRERSPSASLMARQALEEVSLLAITSFPQTIIPNKLLQELRALVKEAQLAVPLVEELAVDIFMGAFGEHFYKAARGAGELMEGTLYARYYNLNYVEVRKLRETGAISRLLSAKESSLAQWCADRAGVELGTWKPAINGMIVEQQQIVTTQNLAALYAGLGLGAALGPRLEELARKCFVWICRRQQMRASNWHAGLITLKLTAYGWRQMVFYLSLLPRERVEDFLKWSGAHVEKQREGYRLRMEPALKGLAEAAADRDAENNGGRRFLGWAAGRHWVMGEVKKEGGR
jgi:hypothetical protein